MRAREASARQDLEDVRRAVAGDGGAFEALYRRHVARVHTLARRLLGRERADEATQEVFVRLWHKLASYRAEAAFASWLHKVATNAILSLGRELGRAAERAGDADVAEAGEIPPAGPGSDARLDLEAALSGLPERARQVFCLHDVEGHTHEEVADLLGIEAGTSKSQLHRARRLLRERLSPPLEGSAPGAGASAERSDD